MKLPIVIRIFKGNHLESVKQFSDPQIVIGQADSVQLHLPGSEVAPLHAVIEERDSGYYLSDLGSQTGTIINGSRILDEPIASGQSIEIGPYRLDFFVGIPKPSAPPQTSQIGDPISSTNEATGVFPSPPTTAADTQIKIPTSLPTQDDRQNKVGSLPKYMQAAHQDRRENGLSSPSSQLPEIASLKTPEKGTHGENESSSQFSSSTRISRSVVTANKAGTFAPPSEVRNLSEIIKPGKGTVIEVIVAWKERILSSNHFSERGMVRIGSSPENEIVLPSMGGTLSHSLVRIDSLATVCVNGDMTGELITESGSQTFSELIRQNRLVRNSVGFEIHLEQGEMLRVGMSGDLINIYIRYVAEAPKPIVAPLLDLSASEVTGVILAAVVALTFGLYMMVYAPKKLEDETLLEEPLRKAVVIFKPPRPTPVVEATEPKVVPTPEKKIVKIVEKSNPAPTPKPQPAAKQTQAPAAKPNPTPPSQTNSGKAAEAKPNPNKNAKKILTSARQGGAINTGKSGASPSSEKVDVSKVGLLGTFGSRGTQSKLDKAYSGSGELSGLADSATGFAGQAEDREGDNIGSKLKSAGAGGKGTATVGIAGLGTTGKGSGTFGYGSGGLGNKSRVEVQVGGQEAEFVGSMDREAIRRRILANKRVIRNCYEMALARSPDLFGKLVIQWDIEEGGRVANAKVVSNSLGNQAVANCLIQRLKTWKFPDPPPDQVGRVTYPFVFASQ